MQGKSTKQKNLNAFMGVQKFSNFNRPKKEQYLVVTLIAMHGHYSQIVSIFIKYVLNNNNYFIGGNFKNAVGIFVGGKKSLLLSIFESETKKT